MPSVLLVEDDESMAAALQLGFEHEGFKVFSAQDGATALRLIVADTPDIVILDVMLPQLSGLDVCKRLRESGNMTPIIMLTARGQEIDKVVGLKIGADDYITKPFGFLELLARVEAVLRRAQPSRHVDSYEFGDLRIDFKKLQATKANQPLSLSTREFAILEYFVRHRGETVTRDQLLNAVWGYESFPLTRTVDTHLAKLRHKIEDNSGDPKYLITVHRAGYRFTG